MGSFTVFNTSLALHISHGKQKSFKSVNSSKICQESPVNMVFTCQGFLFFYVENLKHFCLTTDSSMQQMLLWLMSRVVSIFQVGMIAVTGQLMSMPSGSHWANSAASGTKISYRTKSVQDQYSSCNVKLG